MILLILRKFSLKIINNNENKDSSKYFNLLLKERIKIREILNNRIIILINLKI